METIIRLLLGSISLAFLTLSCGPVSNSGKDECGGSSSREGSSCAKSDGQLLDSKAPPDSGISEIDWNFGGSGAGQGEDAGTDSPSPASPVVDIPAVASQPSVQPDPDPADPSSLCHFTGDKEIQSDVVIVATQDGSPCVWKYGKIRIRGSLTIEKGAHLIVDQCELGLEGRFGGEKNYLIRGKLDVRAGKIGGSKVDNRIIQSNFLLEGGTFYSYDTTIQYTWGQFATAPLPLPANQQPPNVIHTRPIAGENPDALIMNDLPINALIDGHATNSNKVKGFPVKLSFPLTGVPVNLWLQNHSPYNGTFDSSVLPGVSYKLELKDAVVPWWWFEVQKVRKDGPLTDINLNDVPAAFAAVTAENLRFDDGEIVEFPGSIRLNTGIPKRSSFRFGNAQFNTWGQPAAVKSWNLYFWGPETDIRVKNSYLTELIILGGRLSQTGEQIIDTADKNAAAKCVHTCTATKAGEGARITIENCSVGAEEAWATTGVCKADGVGSEIEVKNSFITNATFSATNGAKIIVKDSIISKNVHFSSESNGEIIESNNVRVVP
jgi:hypothetical protein